MAFSYTMSLIRDMPLSFVGHSPSFLGTHALFQLFVSVPAIGQAHIGLDSSTMMSYLELRGCKLDSPRQLSSMGRQMSIASTLNTPQSVQALVG